jgi:hypothetical protein
MEYQHGWGMDSLEREGPFQAFKGEIARHPFNTLAKGLDLFGADFVAEIAGKKTVYP